jgi:beta-phosphoglucomutase
MNKDSTLGIIFDLDGTLIDSESVHLKLYQQLALKIGYKLSDQEYMLNLRGMTDSETFRYLLQKTDKECSVTELVSEKQREYHNFLEGGEVSEIKGAIDYVHQLFDGGFLLAVATSASHEEAKLSLVELGIADDVKVIVSAESVLRGKPAPDIYLYSAQCLGLLPHQCLVYEDSISGVQAACRAGMQVIGVGNMDSNALKAAGAHAVINDFSNCSSKTLQLSS